MSTEDNKALLRRFYESYNDKDLDASYAMVSPNIINHTFAFGVRFTRESWRDMEKMTFPALPDYALTINDQIAEGDIVVTRYTVTGTHKGILMGIAPTGRAIAITGISIDRVANGQIVEHWFEGNHSQVFQELQQPERPGASEK